MTDTTLPPEIDSLEAGNLPPVETAAAGKKAAGKKAAAAVAAAAPTRVKIVLEENDNIPPTGLFIGVNGRSYLLRPGEEVAVPEEVVEALNDAVEENPRTDSNNNVLDYRKKMRFPYRIVS